MYRARDASIISHVILRQSTMLLISDRRRLRFKPECIAISFLARILWLPDPSHARLNLLRRSSPRLLWLSAPHARGWRRRGDTPARARFHLISTAVKRKQDQRSMPAA